MPINQSNYQTLYQTLTLSNNQSTTTTTNFMSCECPNCKKDNILNGTLVIDCPLCSNKIDATSKFQVMPDKSVVCETCVTAFYVLCRSCNKLHKKTAMKTVNSINEDGITKEQAPVCEKCYNNNYRTCNECSELFNRNDVISHNEKAFCKICFNKTYQMCSHCQGTFPKGSVTHTIRGRNAVCDKCHSYYGPIQLYETKPVMAFHGKPPHYYGIELECELVSKASEERGGKAQEVVDLLPPDFAVLKEDGSLSCGFEICTQPATVEEHKIRFDKFFEKLPAGIHSFNTANCGLHIHCSKKPLSLLTIAKIVVFVNETNNQEFVETIAGRKSCRYSCIQKKEYATVKSQITNGRARGERYEAVNLLNKDTIEFRIFKGTLKRESFYKALEFCDSLIRFCSTATNSIVYSRNKENFIKYVAENHKSYPHLYAFICAKVLKQENKMTKKFGFSLATPAGVGDPQPTVTNLE